ncbi:VOC family protein [Bacillus sp. DTU_2020_1000418_1_SI_GHA_SEK_038]|uniref:VOC family protein n=1 Tax=Bacillus sp. DTU_2020_1000418_1_SI_GHA_SEK_038 TaxID=3077585 RepID=UPI0028E3C3E4|nr:VOC family protein [Bacillus sp. DTU_2020_1000418_1_SI_GHA_SEK_038]WNS75385.1 VOC family protein [Bacillus sp. DTU_2020_1000418_1_SI_GHA_SEK_038]
MSSFHKKPNVYVGEVNIKVKDLKTSLTFYQNLMGFKVLEESSHTAVLTTDGKTPLVTLEQPADVIPKTGRTSGLYHYAILLPTRADLSVFLRHLLQTGYRFGAADHYVSEALYLNDPDGNGIEVYRDRPSDEWNWKNGLVDMATEQLDGEGILAESNAEWTGLPADTLMGHIHLHVADLQQTEEFYTQGLGFQTVCYYPQAAFLSTGGYHHHIAINTWQGVGAPPPPENSVGLNWYTLVFPNSEARDNVVAQLKEIGASVKIEEDYYVTSDPAGNWIRLVV